MPTTEHFKPEGREEFKKTLSERLKGSSKFEYLYPDRPKEVALETHYSPDAGIAL